jgi:formate hydrogenlyase subunit 6/NADH:ubiquinone oxidoreductase subunit I
LGLNKLFAPKRKNSSRTIIRGELGDHMVKKPHAPAVFKRAIVNTFSKPATELYPAQKPHLPEKYRGQPCFDFSACTGCGLCSRDCPAKAIEMVTVDGKHRPQVNLSKCVFCYQCAETCPHEAVKTSCVYELATTDKSSLVMKPQTTSSIDA